uniref:Z-DNA-binding protein 1 n=1 Tax=Prolemur simus TaxID=1328070 RepID=A0A8C8YAU7_PROSS
MTQAPAAPGKGGHLEQKILQELSDAGCPVKTSQLVKKCQVPKKELNQVLYRMKNESKVSLAGPALWCLYKAEPADAAPAQLALPSHAERSPEDAAGVPEKPGPQRSDRQEKIYKFLEDKGPHNALVIAQALGLRTAKDVNPDLYKMKSKHLLDFDEKLKAWAIYRPGDSGGRNQSTAIVNQQSPVIAIYQHGTYSHISIANSHNTQIGHGNVIAREITPRDSGKSSETLRTRDRERAPTLPGEG